jgi:hypothetical protein
VDSLAPAEIVDQKLHIVIDGGEQIVREQAPVASLAEEHGDPPGDGEGHVRGGNDSLLFFDGESVLQRTENGMVGGGQCVSRVRIGNAGLARFDPQVMHGRVGEADRVLHDSPPQIRGGLQQHAGGTREVSRFVDDAAPQFAAFPKAVVRGVGAEDEQQT